MKNILADLPLNIVRTEPFVYLYAEDVLPDEIALQLITELPAVKTIAKNRNNVPENTRLDYMIQDMRNDRGTNNEISPLWQEFMEANASKEFVQDFFRLFGPHIKKMYSQYDHIAEHPGQIRVGTRGIDSFDTHDVLADANIGVNTPISKKASSVRTAHLDDPRKLYGGLLYLRHPDDDSVGGEFCVYKYKHGTIPRFTRQQIDMHDVEEIARVPYKRNSLVLFLNSFDAVHGVTPRHPTKHTRQFLNIIGDGPEPHFDISHFQEKGKRKFIRRVLNKFNIGLGGVEQRK